MMFYIVISDDGLIIAPRCVYVAVSASSRTSSSFVLTVSISV